MPDASTFSFYQICWYFILYSVLGWCIEVIFCSVNTGKFVNRGFLNGPVCPIYGFGGTLVILLLTPLADNLLLLFVGSVIVTSLLELVTGFVLKKLFHTSWWDYSDQPFNIGGYVCLKFSLAWGVACVLLMRVVHPLVARFVNWIPPVLGIVLLCVAFAVLLLDFGVTLAAMLKLQRDLGQITKVAQSLHKGSDAMAEGIGNTAISVAGRIEELDLEGQAKKVAAKWEDDKEKVKASVERQKEKWDTLLAGAKDKLDPLFGHNQRIRTRLFKAFPGAKSQNNEDAMEHLRHRLLSPKQDSAAPNGQQKTGKEETGPS